MNCVTVPLGHYGHHGYSQMVHYPIPPGFGSDMASHDSMITKQGGSNSDY